MRPDPAPVPRRARGTGRFGAIGRTVSVLALTLLIGPLLSGCTDDGRPASGAPLLEVSEAQASAPVAGTSQLVLEIANRGDGDDRLVGATTDVALAIEIHRTEIEPSGRAFMRRLDDVVLPAGETVRFRPGGLHLMVVVPDATVVLDATFEVTLTFSRSGPVTLTVPVVALLDLIEETAGHGGAGT